VRNRAKDGGGALKSQSVRGGERLASGGGETRTVTGIGYGPFYIGRILDASSKGMMRKVVAAQGRLRVEGYCLQDSCLRTTSEKKTLSSGIGIARGTSGKFKKEGGIEHQVVGRKTAIRSAGIGATQEG